GKLLFPAALELRLHRHGLERFHAGHGFDQERLVLGAALEFLVKPPAKQRGRPNADADIERKAEQNERGQPHRIDQHHGDEDEGEQDIDHQGQRGTGDEGADILQFTDPRDGITDAPGLEIIEWQGEQMTKQPRPKLDIDTVGGIGENIGPQRAQDGFEDRDGGEADDEDFQRADAAMHQDLVDDDLKEERRDQREHLQEKL